MFYVVEVPQIEPPHAWTCLSDDEFISKVKSKCDEYYFEVIDQDKANKLFVDNVPQKLQDYITQESMAYEVWFPATKSREYYSPFDMVEEFEYAYEILGYDLDALHFLNEEEAKTLVKYQFHKKYQWADATKALEMALERYS